MEREFSKSIIKPKNFGLSNVDYLKKELFIVLITGMTLHTTIRTGESKKEAIEKLIK
ncbi:hypothetical protein [Escherichia coli]|uniref:hypothetical protein n=1 Tax=Escherichia coli TaxID=562 RepID=UPI00388E2E7F